MCLVRYVWIRFASNDFVDLTRFVERGSRGNSTRGQIFARESLIYRQNFDFNEQWNSGCVVTQSSNCIHDIIIAIVLLFLQNIYHYAYLYFRLSN
jgi:hypothetical protein